MDPHVRKGLDHALSLQQEREAAIEKTMSKYSDYSGGMPARQSARELASARSKTAQKESALYHWLLSMMAQEPLSKDAEEALYDLLTRGPR